MAQESRVVEPNFIVSDDGRVACTKHTLFGKPREKPQAQLAPILNIFAPPQSPPLTCHSCGHYLEDSCYFAPQSIDQILSQRDRGQIICDFCGDRITRSMSVLQKIYYENKFRVKMPLVCCECFATLKNNNFTEQSRKNLAGWVVRSVIALVACLSLLWVPGWGVPIMLVCLVFYGSLTYNSIRKSYYTWKGMKRYKELEAKLKQ